MQSLKTSYTALILLSFILTAYGLLILYSTIQPLSDGQRLFTKQCIWLFIAILAGFFSAFINLEKLQSISLIIGGATLGLLILVLIPGISRPIKGAHRWIELLGLRIQASEPAKIGFTLFFAEFLFRYMHNRNGLLKDFLRSVCVVGIFCLLLILEPDFGTAILFGMVATILLFIRGVRLSFLGSAILPALTLFCIAVYLNPVRFNRIMAFLNLEHNRLTGAYQLWQGLMAFSSGGWFGCGLGKGRQKAFFLPESHTDFIGAVLAEELGIVHVFVVLTCFGLITLFGFKIAYQQRQPFLFYVGMGSVCFITIQVLLNLGVITGLLPTKGISLPFLSYGGSSLVANFSFIGLLINLARNSYLFLNLSHR